MRGDVRTSSTYIYIQYTVLFSDLTGSGGRSVVDEENVDCLESHIPAERWLDSYPLQ